MSRLLIVSVLLASCAQILGIQDRGGDDGDSGQGSGGPATSCLAATDDCMGHSCCDSPVVEGGTFFRSYDVASDAKFSDMSAPATLKSFRLDRYEVTVGRFRTFVDAGKGTKLDPPAAGTGANAFYLASGWDSMSNTNLPANPAALLAALKCQTTMSTWTDLPDANEHKPINCLTWELAFAFCAWDAGFLPTEAEWNYAAAGGAEQRAYPWSIPPGDTTLTADQAVWVEAYIAEVGTKPAGVGRWHQSDLAGNAMEWVIDRYANMYLTPCIDCAYVMGSSTYRGIRGGGYFQTADFQRTASRGSQTTASYNAGVGVRCARLP